MRPETLNELLRAYGGREAACVVISRIPPEAGYAKFAGRVRWLTGVRSAADVDEPRRADLAVVFDQLEHMPAREAAHLLATLRDRHARRVVVDDAAGTFGISEMLGLGFEKAAGIGLEHGYLYDPDSPSRQREWNSPENWANPQNFDKYRW